VCLRQTGRLVSAMPLIRGAYPHRLGIINQRSLGVPEFSPRMGSSVGGRYWDRTSGLLRVKEALSH
jgi:hypothetical protein